mmetsp:Transcript_71571/g.167574  ORF Transcript_71571/g.167574 Transcript_71571/m.167574 type:complete len:216 (-) Transcript_71571:1416-2063(-)
MDGRCRRKDGKNQGHRAKHGHETTVADDAGHQRLVPPNLLQADLPSTPRSLFLGLRVRHPKHPFGDVPQRLAFGLELPWIEEQWGHHPGCRRESSAKVEAGTIVHTGAEDQQHNDLHGIVKVSRREASEVLYKGLPLGCQAPSCWNVLSTAIVQGGLEEVRHKLRLEGREDRAARQKRGSQIVARRETSFLEHCFGKVGEHGSEDEEQVEVAEVA